MENCNDELKNIIEGNEEGVTLLHYAASKGYVDLMEELINDGADVNAADIDGYTPLYYAVNDCHIAAVEILLKNGADVNVKDYVNGFTPLHYCALYTKENYEEIAQLLLNYGADLKAKCNMGHTPSKVAFIGGNFYTLDFLTSKEDESKTEAETT